MYNFTEGNILLIWIVSCGKKNIFMQKCDLMWDWSSIMLQRIKHISESHFSYTVKIYSYNNFVICSI